MSTVTGKLTVFFEDPFWVGVYERAEAGKLEACRVVFGAEPKDADVYDFFLKNWHRLRFSPPVRLSESARTVSPKRARRLARRQVTDRGVGTKAQQALAQQREAGKQERRVQTRRRDEAEKERQFAMRQLHRREKHKGH